MVDGHIVTTRTLMPDADRRLRLSGHHVRQASSTGPVDEATLLRLAPGAAALIVTVEERVDQRVLDAAGSNLKIVANVAVGTDNIDLETCRARGVLVTNTPDVLSEATADLAMGLLLAVSRRLVEADSFVRTGQTWAWYPEMFVGPPVHGATLGIVGLGRIGRAMARRSRGFGMEVIAAASPSGRDDGDIPRFPLDELLRRVDVLSLHTPLTPATRGLIGEEELARMPDHSLLINTARGGCVDQDALVRALEGRTIAGAGLDVFADEPHVPPALRALPNVVLTPHIGSADRTTRTQMCQLAVENVLRVLNGQPPQTPV